MEYIEKLRQIDAIQYTPENLEAIKELAGEKFIEIDSNEDIVIETEYGEMYYGVGEWVIKNQDGTFDLCSTSSFHNKPPRRPPSGDTPHPRVVLTRISHFFNFWRIYL